MPPQTPSKTHTRRISAISTPGTPATPPSGYVLAQEETPTRGPERGSETDQELQLRHHEPEQEQEEAEQPANSQPANSTSGTGSRSTMNDDSILEVMDDDESGSGEGEEEMMFSEEEGDEEEGYDAGEPLVSRGPRRGRRRWDEEEEKKERSLIEVRIKVGFG